MKKKTSIIALISGLILLFINCKSNDKYTLNFKQTVENNWYYEIYFEDQLLIKQEYIPALPGQQKFKNKKEVKKVGELVFKKIKDGESPSISLKELKALNLIKDN